MKDYQFANAIKHLRVGHIVDIKTTNSCNYKMKRHFFSHTYSDRIVLICKYGKEIDIWIHHIESIDSVDLSLSFFTKDNFILEEFRNDVFGFDNVISYKHTDLSFWFKTDGGRFYVVDSFGYSFEIFNINEVLDLFNSFKIYLNYVL